MTRLIFAFVLAALRLMAKRASRVVSTLDGENTPLVRAYVVRWSVFSNLLAA